jgi:hypothetical protein
MSDNEILCEIIEEKLNRLAGGGDFNKAEIIGYYTKVYNNIRRKLPRPVLNRDIKNFVEDKIYRAACGNYTYNDAYDSIEEEFIQFLKQ